MKRKTSGLASEDGTPAGTAARPARVLIISQGAPGVAKDANSIMLWRLLKYFPASSYVVLASSKNWPDGRVPLEQQEQGYHSFSGAVVRPGSEASHEGVSVLARSAHSTLWNLKDRLSKSRAGRSAKAVLHRLLDPAFFFAQVRSAVGTGTAIVEKGDITSILAVSDDGPCLIAGLMVHRRTGIPLDLFIFDLWKENVSYWFQQLMASVFQRRIFVASRWIFSAGEGISEYLETESGRKSIVVRNSFIARNATSRGYRSMSASPMLVLFTGSIDWPQLDGILDMIAAVHDMDGVEFHIYSYQSEDELRVLGVTGKNVVLHQGLSEDEVRDRQAAADVLYLPLSFGRKGRRIVQTAQPAKSVEYMASGVPILVHAPPYAFVTRYVREHDIAVVVDQPGPDGVVQALRALMSDKTDGQRKAAKAVELVGKSYDSLEVSHLLQSYVLRERTLREVD